MHNRINFGLSFKLLLYSTRAEVRFLGRQQLALQQYWEVVDVGDTVFGICGVGHNVHRRGKEAGSHVPKLRSRPRGSTDGRGGSHYVNLHCHTLYSYFSDLYFNCTHCVCIDCIPRLLSSITRQPASRNIWADQQLEGGGASSGLKWASTSCCRRFATSGNQWHII